MRFFLYSLATITLCGYMGCTQSPTTIASSADLTPLPGYTYYALEDDVPHYIIVPLPSSAKLSKSTLRGEYLFKTSDSITFSLAPSTHAKEMEINSAEDLRHIDPKNIRRKADGTVSSVRVEEELGRKPGQREYSKSTYGVLLWSRDEAAIGVSISGKIPVVEGEKVLWSIESGILYDESLSSANQVAKHFGAKVKILTYNR
ncbi:MAG: hypothetical protein JST40_06405 [Armatimonadetes bacterium]|nr:hypothetical protein [Armatimonadota bacterium]